MENDSGARNEYIKFVILILFFAGLMAVAAVIRPVILGEWQLSSPVQASRTFVPTLVEVTLDRGAVSIPSPSPTSQAATVTPDELPSSRFHEVRPGDTLVAIGQIYGLAVDDLIAANRLVDPDRLSVGQRVRIPEPGEQPPPITYIVQWGDTLWGISGQFQVSFQDLVSANQIDDPALLEAGSILFIPR